MDVLRETQKERMDWVHTGKLQKQEITTYPHVAYVLWVCCVFAKDSCKLCVNITRVVELMWNNSIISTV